MWELFKEIVSKLDSLHLFLLIPLVVLSYLTIVLIRFLEKKDQQLMVFAEKTIEHTKTITRLIDVLNSAISGGRVK